jgi:hypothetical protein
VYKLLFCCGRAHVESVCGSLRCVRFCRSDGSLLGGSPSLNVKSVPDVGSVDSCFTVGADSAVLQLSRADF